MKTKRKFSNSYFLDSWPFKTEKCRGKTMYVWLPQLFVFLFSIFSFILRPIRFIFLEVLTLKPFLTHALNDLTCLQLFLNMTWFNVIWLEKKNTVKSSFFLLLQTEQEFCRSETDWQNSSSGREKTVILLFFFHFRSFEEKNKVY